MALLEDEYRNEERRQNQEEIAELEPRIALLESSDTGLQQSSLFKDLTGIFGGIEDEQEETSYIGGLEKETAAAKAKADASFETLQDILASQRREKEERFASMNKPLTDEELDRRRASGTLVATITSALANIANGISVGRGANNATVPDGYMLSYQHWNDIEKRNAARRQEYEKMTDSILKSRLAEAEVKYGKDSKEYSNAQTRLDAARTMQARHQNTMEEIDSRGTWKKVVKETASPTKTKTGGGSKSTKQPKTLDDYRTISNGNSTITIPDGVSVEQAYLAIAEKALQWVDANDELNDALKAKFRISFTGNVSKNEAVIVQFLKDLRSTGLTGTDIQDAIDGLTPSQPQQQPRTTTQTTNTSNQNNGGSNGRTRQQNDSGLF